MEHCVSIYLDLTHVNTFKYNSYIFALLNVSLLNSTATHDFVTISEKSIYFSRDDLF